MHNKLNAVQFFELFILTVLKLLDNRISGTQVLVLVLVMSLIQILVSIINGIMFGLNSYSPQCR